MFSLEMQMILGIALAALVVLGIWGLWRRTVRQSVPVLLLAIGLVVLLAISGPILWWQVSTRVPGTFLQPAALSDHRIGEPLVRAVDGYRRLEIDVQLIVPSLPAERLEEIARAVLQERLSSGRFDLASARLLEHARPRFYFYAHKREINAEQVKAWLQPDPTEINRSSQLAPPRRGQLGDYHTIAMTMSTSAKWSALNTLLKTNPLASAWAAVDESLYDYIALSEDDTLKLVLLFALVNEEFLRQYQSAGGRPEELGLLGAAIPTPSLLVIVLGIESAVLRLGDLALVQTTDEQGSRRIELRELALREELAARAPWVRLVGNFPNYPNLLAPLRLGEQSIGLLRFPLGLDPARQFQIYYGDRWASLGKK